MTNLIWLQEWFNNQCDGEWEHGYGIRIETLDNPGWSITIETIDTSNELEDFDWLEFKNSDQDWYYYRVKEGVFEGAGDPSKLCKLLSLFQELVL